MVMPNSQWRAVSSMLNRPQWPIRWPSASIANSVLSPGGSAAFRSKIYCRRSRVVGLGGSLPPASSTSTSFQKSNSRGRSSRVTARSVTFRPGACAGFLEERRDQLAFHQVRVALALAHDGPPVSPDEDLGGAGAGVVVGGHREAVGAGAHDGSRSPSL